MDRYERILLKAILLNELAKTASKKKDRPSYLRGFAMGTLPGAALGLLAARVARKELGPLVSKSVYGIYPLVTGGLTGVSALPAIWAATRRRRRK